MKDELSITLDNLPKIAEALKAIRRQDLPGAGQRPLSKRQAVIGLAEELLAKKREGFTTEDLLEALQAHNLVLKPSALNRYLKEYQAARQPRPDEAAKKRGRPAKRDEDCNAPNTATDPADSLETTSQPPVREPISAEHHSRNEAA
jgi:hypothetical protein